VRLMVGGCVSDLVGGGLGGCVRVVGVCVCVCVCGLVGEWVSRWVSAWIDGWNSVEL